jgi:aspartate/methionine/tyrosine aminotransferase
MREARRVSLMQTPVIPVIGELVRSNPGTISLGQGVVHYGPPPQAFERMSAALADHEIHKYKPVQGIPPLIEAIDEKLLAENGIRISNKNAVVVTAGGNMAFVAALLAIADPGDEIIVLTPYYFNHEMAVAMAGCVPVPVETDKNYQLRPDSIMAAITDRTRAIVTISPNNPTGAVYPESALREINRICAELGIYHVHDEAYEYFTYDGATHFSPGSIPGSEKHTISLFSLSKSYGFASWRVGYMVIPTHLMGAVKKILDTVVICPPVVSQFAALGALEAGPSYAREQILSIAEVRRLALKEMEALGNRCVIPPANGAFYFLICVDTDLEPMQMVERLVVEHKVAVIPGSTFGIEKGCYLRVAYGALQKDTVVEGIGRLVGGICAIVDS